MLKLLAGLALACLCTPAQAATGCSDQVSALLKAVKTDGGAVVANLKLKTPVYDREISS